MKQITKFIQEGLRINKNTKIDNYHYHPKDKNELIELVEKLIKERGNKADLNDIDTSEITDMSGLFKFSKFNGDISRWDVSNVTDMSRMFKESKFSGKNGDISEWDVSNVTNMEFMFFCAKSFNIDLYKWNTNNVKNMRGMFIDTKVSDNPPKWWHNNK